MNDMERIVRWIQGELKLGPKEMAERRNHPSGQEVGLKHPFAAPQVLLRDDNAVEVTAGPAVSLIADGNSGIANVRGPAVAIEGQQVHVHAPDYYWGFQRWDPLHWWRATVPGEVASWLWNGPLVANDPGALATLLSTPFVTGQPHSLDPDDTPFQQTTTLGALIHAQPLLGPDETLIWMGLHLAGLLQSLAIP